jgi:hypothetical protein
MTDATESRPSDLFAAAHQQGQAELKAHAALYAAREAAAAAAPSPEPVVVTARPRVIPQGGAVAARKVRERLMAEHKAVVVDAAQRFRAGGPGLIPRASILKIRLADLPRLLQPGRDTDRLS